MTPDPRTDALSVYLDEALVLRAGAGFPPIDGGPSDILPSLIDVRQRLDRVEELLRSALVVRANVAADHDLAKAEADDAFDTEITAARSGRGDGEFTTARERHAA